MPKCSHTHLSRSRSPLDDTSSSKCECADRQLMALVARETCSRLKNSFNAGVADIAVRSSHLAAAHHSVSTRAYRRLDA